MLYPGWTTDYVPNWIKEDGNGLDYSSFILNDKISKFLLFYKTEDEAFFVGKSLIEDIIEFIDRENSTSIEWLIHDKDIICGPKLIAEITGTAAKILYMERIILNLVSHCSSIATFCYKSSQVASSSGWAGKIAATRKTTPGLRIFEKYSVAMAGLDPHRFGLLGGSVMIKDNMIDIIGIENAIDMSKKYSSFTQKIEIECRSHKEALIAVNKGVDIIMLDNFTILQADITSKAIKSLDSDIIVEASGGIDPEALKEFCKISTIDVISMGCLIRNAPSLDFSLTVRI